MYFSFRNTQYSHFRDEQYLKPGAMGSWSPGEDTQQEQPQFVVPLNNNTQVSYNYHVTDQYKARNLTCSTTIKEGLIIFKMTTNGKDNISEHEILFSVSGCALFLVQESFFGNCPTSRPPQYGNQNSKLPEEVYNCSYSPHVREWTSFTTSVCTVLLTSFGLKTLF